MNEKHRLTIGLLKLLDLAILVFAFGLTTLSIVKEEHGVSLVQFLSMRTRVVNLLIFILALFICHVCFRFAVYTDRDGCRGAEMRSWMS